MSSEAKVRNSECGIRNGVSGFTLMEIMVTVLIIGILASMALPQYQKTSELGYRRDAQDLLLTIYYGERAYFLANAEYTDPVGNWNKIYMENPNIAAIPVAFKVPIATKLAFTARATRTAGGLCGGDILEIDETRTTTGSWLACP